MIDTIEIHLLGDSLDTTLPGQLFLPPTAQRLFVLPSLGFTTVDNEKMDILTSGNDAALVIGLLGESEVRYPSAASDIARLSDRLLAVLDYIHQDESLQTLPLGICAEGALTPVAIRVAARRDQQVKALACHDGLVANAGKEALQLLSAPLLMLFSPENSNEISAFARARTYLRVTCQSTQLNADDPAWEQQLAWCRKYC